MFHKTLDGVEDGDRVGEDAEVCSIDGRMLPPDLLNVGVLAFIGMAEFEVGARPGRPLLRDWHGFVEE